MKMTTPVKKKLRLIIIDLVEQKEFNMLNNI